jgi:hypothetical protein
MVFAQEPVASAWEHGAAFAVQKTAEHPDVVFPLLAILGPVVRRENNWPSVGP